MENNELAHWGIKGMKWGVRRYQNKDGSLTAAGKKRRDKLEAELESLGGKKAATDNTSSSSSGKKSMKDMTDEELISAIRRSQLEKQYRDLDRDLNPIKESKFAKAKDAAASAAIDAGKSLLGDFLKNKGKELLGLNEKEAKSLKQIMEDSNAKRRILENEDWFENRKKKKAKDDKSSDKKDKSSDKKDDSSETLEGEVFGEGSSKRKNTNDRTSTRDSSYYDPIDVDFSDVSASSPQSQAIVEYGRSQVIALLGPPGEKDD